MERESSFAVGGAIKVRILIVDNDMCLDITASVFKIYNYEVVTTKCPLEAISILQASNSSFDIILSDLQTSLVGDLNFQKVIKDGCQVPLIFKSTSNNKYQLMESMENKEAPFYVIKPISLEDIKRLWNYATSMKMNNMIITNSLGKQVELCDSEINKRNEKETITNVKIGDSSKGKTRTNNQTKKKQMIWSYELHNKFVEAVEVIGISRATPKRISEYMCNRELTRANIASHLQKYRTYYKNKKNEPSFSSNLHQPHQEVISSSLIDSSYVGRQWRPSSLLNLQPIASPLLPPSFQSIGANLAQESLMLNGENNDNYDNGGDLVSAIMQFMPQRPHLMMASYGANEQRSTNDITFTNDDAIATLVQTQVMSPIQYSTNFNDFSIHNSNTSLLIHDDATQDFSIIFPSAP